MTTNEKYQQKLERYQAGLDKARQDEEKYYRKLTNLQYLIMELEKKVRKYRICCGFLEKNGEGK